MSTEITIDTGTNELLCAIRDRVAVITLNRPEVRNALSDNLTPALRNMVKTCGENSDVGALLITGAGTAFCAGGDVKGMGAHRDKKNMSYDEKVADLQERQRLLASAAADRIRVVAAADKERLRGEAEALKSNPLLINKIVAEKLSDKIQVLMVPADGKFFFASDVLTSHAQQMFRQQEQGEDPPAKGSRVSPGGTQ